MQTINSFLQNLMTYFSNLSKRVYRNAAVLMAGVVIIAVVSFQDTNFNGSGKNVVYAAAEPEEVKMEEEAQNPEEVQTGEEDVQVAFVDESMLNVRKPLSEESLSEARMLVGERIEQQTQEALAQPMVLEISDADYDTLLRIVEAEAGVCDYHGKVLVANVVINRVKSTQFPDSIRSVVYQHKGSSYQFSPVKSGSINRVSVTDETRQAVEAALYGEDYSQGALFFAARSKSNPKSLRWFDNNLQFLFEHDGHEFFTSRS